jgi:hypothetical protein
VEDLNLMWSEYVKEMEAVGLDYLATKNLRQFIYIFGFYFKLKTSSLAKK